MVGAGPAGYYAIAALLKHPNFQFDVTILDKQFSPFGLVRTGVAPDHPEVLHQSILSIFHSVALN